MQNSERAYCFDKESTINQCYIYFTVLGAAIKCKRYSGITVETVIHGKTVQITLNILEIKPCGLGSRIRDTEAEWRLKVITDLISY